MVEILAQPRVSIVRPEDQPAPGANRITERLARYVGMGFVCFLHVMDDTKPMAIPEWGRAIAAIDFNFLQAM